MEIILLERIGRLGKLGDVVTVKDGYARNFLLPQKKALRATKQNLERFEGEREELEKRNAQLRAEADTSGANIDGNSFVIIRQAGDTGQLYGSVSTRDIADAVSAQDVDVKRNQVILDRPIKLLGLHEIRIALHAEVTVTVIINVARTEDDAERQARGEDVTADEFDEDDGEEAMAPAEELFEDEEQARQAAEELAEVAVQDDAEGGDGDTDSPDTAMVADTDDGAEVDSKDARNEE